MMTTNRYDRLMDKQKKLRNKVEKINNKADAKVKALQMKINHIKYVKNVRCDDLGYKLQDTVSLTKNYVKRIYGENKEFIEYQQKLENEE